MSFEKNRMLDKVLRGKTTRRVNVNKYLATAATLIILISSVVFSQWFDGNEVPNTAEENGGNSDIQVGNNGETNYGSKDNPNADIEYTKEIQFSLGDIGMGYSAILAFGREDLANKNPWSENMDLVTLPVYRNELYNVEWYTFFTKEDMQARAENIAKLLGVKIIEVNDGDHTYNCEQDITISINPDFSASIHWGNVVKLPEITATDEYSKQLAYIEYYYLKFEELFDFNEPEFEVVSAFNIDGTKNYDHYVFDNSEIDQQKVLNYKFEKVRIGIHENGMGVIHLPSTYNYEKVEEYPIISKKKALSNIIDGKYLTTVPHDEDISIENIAKIELVYYTNIMTEYFQPVYVAYVKLENEETIGGSGLNSYGLYYTPAVEGQYVDIVIEQVHFN